VIAGKSQSGTVAAPRNADAEFEAVGDGLLSDEAIAALATLLLDSIDAERSAQETSK